MIQKTIRLAVIIIFMGLLAPAFAGAAPATTVASGVCGGANLSVTAEACPTNGSTDATLNNIIKTVIDLLTLVVGFMAVVGFIFGAYYAALSSSGSGGAALATKAKNAVIYSLFGLIISVVAQVIVRLVLGKATTSIV